MARVSAREACLEYIHLQRTDQHWGPTVALCLPVRGQGLQQPIYVHHKTETKNARKFTVTVP